MASEPLVRLVPGALGLWGSGALGHCSVPPVPPFSPRGRRGRGMRGQTGRIKTRSLSRDGTAETSCKRPLHIQIANFQGVLVDEFATRLDFVPHQYAEHFVRRAGVGHSDLD